MKATITLLASAAVLAALPLSAASQPARSHQPQGQEKQFDDYTMIRLENLRGVRLGRIKDLAVDLANGRIVEVLVQVDRSLGAGARVVAVPPCALIADPDNVVYRLNATAADFQSAPAYEPSRALEGREADRIAATYRHFGQVPYFLETQEAVDASAARPKGALGYVTRVSRLLGLAVRDLQGERLGKVWTLALDIPQGRILNVVILAPGHFETKSIVPAMALRFNAAYSALQLDDTKAEFRDEPLYVYTEAAFGQERYYTREPYQSPPTLGPLEQGASYRDLDRTELIKQEIKAAHLGSHKVEVGTNHDRVTLRGWVTTESDKRHIGGIASAASRVELVDNQITVTRRLAID